MGKVLGILASVLLVSLLAAGGIFAYFLLEGTPPDVEMIPAAKTIGRQLDLKVIARDNRSGLRSISAVVVQGDKSVALEPKLFPIANWWRGSGIKEGSVTWQIRPLEMGLKEGPAVLMVSARDASWRDLLKGNERLIRDDITIDVTPPGISLLSTVHNVKIGGCGLVSYKLSENPVRTGVWIDDHFFQAYPKPGGQPGQYVALFAVPYNDENPQKVLIEAVDAAGNRSSSGFPHRIFPRAFKTDKIHIPDSFLQLKMPEFMDRNPGLKGDSLIDVFLQVNRELRKRDNDRLRAVTEKSLPEFLWKGAFRTLPNAAPRAAFADDRHYIYNGKEVDEAHHLGIDLASLAHAPVPAANGGVVAATGYFGIYGNTVILDHGMGLFTTYSHLSEIKVKPGDRVAQGDVVGLTGMTGLAGGDHLHFGMLLDGVFVEPLEWMDAKWIRDHILANLNAN